MLSKDRTEAQNRAQTSKAQKAQVLRDNKVLKEKKADKKVRKVEDERLCDAMLPIRIPQTPLHRHLGFLLPGFH
jgi:hypothetical protein